MLNILLIISATKMLLPVASIVNIFATIVIMTWIKDRRKELNLTQEDLTRSLQLAGFNYVRSTVGHWETGRAPLPVENPSFVDVIAKILKLDTLTVLRLSGYHIEYEHSDESERIARLVDSLPIEKRQLALKLVEQLLD